MLSDPIGVALTQDRLDFISRRMGWAMMRAASSPIFTNSHDFSCFIADSSGQVVSQADGIPIHTGGGGFAVRALLKTFSDSLAPGDVILLNDPYTAGGNHLPDWLIARPIFSKGCRIAFTCNRAHQSDIGGGAPGTYNPAATELFHEGVRLPPLKLVDHGVLRQDLWNLLLLNSRTPQLLDGDLRAMLGATNVGAEMVEQLFRDLGTETATAHFEAVLDHADTVFRHAISSLRAGVYSAQTHVVDHLCPEVTAVIRIAMIVSEEGLTIDFGGTDPQLRGFKNSSIANTHSAVYTALSAFFESSIPRNEGTFRSVTIKAPGGTIVNPHPPAAVGMCTSVPAHQIIEGCWNALSTAAPDRSCAGWGLRMVPITTGTRQSGDVFVMYHMGAHGGGGAVHGRDGFDQIGPLETLGGQLIPDAEAYEQLYPVRIIKQEFRRNACGHGRFRGGSGIDYEAYVETAGTYVFRSEGAAAGLSEPDAAPSRGATGTLRLRLEDGETITPPPYGSANFGPAYVEISSAGGAGCGDPLDRDPKAVLRDVRDGLIDAGVAFDIYGVALQAGGNHVDQAATARAREERARAYCRKSDVPIERNAS